MSSQTEVEALAEAIKLQKIKLEQDQLKFEALHRKSQEELMIALARDAFEQDKKNHSSTIPAAVETQIATLQAIIQAQVTNLRAEFLVSHSQLQAQFTGLPAQFVSLLTEQLASQTNTATLHEQIAALQEHTATLQEQFHAREVVTQELRTRLNELELVNATLEEQLQVQSVSYKRQLQDLEAQIMTIRARDTVTLLCNALHINGLSAEQKAQLVEMSVSSYIARGVLRLSTELHNHYNEESFWARNKSMSDF